MKGRFVGFDGLRAVAVLLVMAGHAHLPYVGAGFVGVDVFFVLSGFLITSLLVSEWDERQSVSITDFYARRALRLFPALVVAALLAVALSREANSASFPGTVSGLPYVVFYIGDIARSFGVNPLGLLGHTWSLAVEEQFYVFWPLFFVTAMRRGVGKTAAAVLLVGIAAVEMGYRTVLCFSGYSVLEITQNPVSRSDGLLIGCAAALWAAARTRPLLRQRSLHVLAAIGVAACLLIVIRRPGSAEVDVWAGIPIIVGTTTMVMLMLVRDGAGQLAAVLELWPLRWVGRRSYGIYLYHFPIFVAFGTEAPHPRHTLPAFAASLAIAEVSYWTIERPALRLKERFRPPLRLSVGSSPSLADGVLRSGAARAGKPGD